MKATGDDRIKSATFLVTMMDFRESGELKVFIETHLELHLPFHTGYSCPSVYLAMIPVVGEKS